MATPRRLKRKWPRGERQAAAIEANLTNLENKLDALLAAFDAGGSESPEAQQLEQHDSKDKNISTQK
ncbi:hypothetical protein F5Y18DRAFT_428188 [Xylariaceae sp. FL1019]|nr:hypothetical protein F5Y18DRAFT_428188 [Xylariaceae sp. FL1019]